MPTIISESTHVRGRIEGKDDLEIDGFVEGEIALDGDILVGQTGRVGSPLAARNVVIRGAVRGDVTGSESVSLEDGARVVGDIRAPRVAIAEGALVRGYVEAGAGGGGKPAPRTAAAPAARPAAMPVKAAAPVQRAPEPTPVKKAAPPPPPPPAAKKAPVPVVPVLKKGAKVVKKSR